MQPATRGEAFGASEEPPRTPGATVGPRDLAIDRFRGALVILMVSGNYLIGIPAVPAFLKHAPDVGLTVADPVAAAFVFVIGLNSGPSFARRMLRGTRRAYVHVMLRYLALIGIGAVISAGTTITTGIPEDWGVLQALGAAGLVCLAFIRLPTWVRFAAGIVMLVAYQFVLDASMLPFVLASTQGGLFGAVSWAALLVLSTAVADVWRRGIRSYALCCAALAAAAAIAAMLVPVSKHRVSLSYVLISLALAAVVLLVVDLAARVVPDRAGFLCWWGENPLLLYLLHLVLLAVVVLPDAAWWYAEAPVWLIVSQLAGILGVLSVAAWWLHWRHTVIRV